MFTEKICHYAEWSGNFRVQIKKYICVTMFESFLGGSEFFDITKTLCNAIVDISIRRGLK